MRKVLAGLFLSLVALSASAQYHGHRGHGHGHWHRGYNSGWNWVVPAVIGGAIVYGATRPETVIVQQPPVIVQQPTPSVVYIDGISYTKQIMIINGVQQEVLVRN